MGDELGNSAGFWVVFFPLHFTTFMKEYILVLGRCMLKNLRIKWPNSPTYPQMVQIKSLNLSQANSATCKQFVNLSKEYLGVTCIILATFLEIQNYSKKLAAASEDLSLAKSRIIWATKRMIVIIKPTVTDYKTINKNPL